MKRRIGLQEDIVEASEVVGWPMGGLNGAINPPLYHMTTRVLNPVNSSSVNGSQVLIEFGEGNLGSTLPNETVN